MKQTIQLPAYLSGFSSLKDGGASIRFATNELSAEDFGLLSEYRNDFGYLLFKGNEFTASDIPATQAEDTQKTPSKRLRSVLFLLWKQTGSNGNFEDYYRTQVEKFIDHVKSKLD